MELSIHRISSGKNDTIGEFFDENQYLMCNTLEDEYREKKLSKETRIWAGRYKLGIRQEITPLTTKYLNDKRIPFFERHIEILNVPQFKGVYIHIGNNEFHTDACVLVGYWQNKNIRRIDNSVKAYTKFYTKYYPLLKQREEIYLNIYDY